MSFLASSSILKMEVICSSETSASVRTIQLHNPEDRIFSSFYFCFQIPEFHQSVSLVQPAFLKQAYEPFLLPLCLCVPPIVAGKVKMFLAYYLTWKK